MEASIAPLATRLDNVEASIGPAVAAAMAPIAARLDNIEARQANSMAQFQENEVHPLRNAAGNYPENFPATFLGLNNLTQQERGNLLAFYGRPRNPVANRELRLNQFLGIRRDYAT
jgi:hypothetical protein